MEFSVFAEAGVVDKQVDFFVAREGKDLFRSGGIGQVCGEHLRFDLVAAGQALRKGFEAVFTPGRKYEVRPAGSEFFRKSHANSRASARDKSPFSTPFGSHHSSAYQEISVGQRESFILLIGI
jgi:hypothetical protein